MSELHDSNPGEVPTWKKQLPEELHRWHKPEATHLILNTQSRWKTQAPHKASEQELSFAKCQCSQRSLFGEDKKKENLMSELYLYLQAKQKSRNKPLDYNLEHTEQVI